MRRGEGEDFPSRRLRARGEEEESRGIREKRRGRRPSKRHDPFLPAA